VSGVDLGPDETNFALRNSERRRASANENAHPNLSTCPDELAARSLDYGNRAMGFLAPQTLTFGKEQTTPVPKASQPGQTILAVELRSGCQLQR
jgi:hypothetical protein